MSSLNQGSVEILQLATKKGAADTAPDGPAPDFTPDKDVEAA